MLYNVQRLSNSKTLYNEHVYVITETVTSTPSIVHSLSLLKALTVFLSEFVQYTRPNPIQDAEVVRINDWISLKLTRPNPWVGSLEDYDNGQI